MSVVGGSAFAQSGPVMVGCMSSEARDLLDDVMGAYRAHYNPETHKTAPDDVYQFAYWLIRWSGLVKRNAIQRTEPDERRDGALWSTCPGCGKYDDTGLPGEVMTGIVHCGYCGTVSCSRIAV